MSTHTVTLSARELELVRRETMKAAASDLRALADQLEEQGDAPVPGAAGVMSEAEESHPERAWKTRACPTCRAQPGEWCLLVAALGAGARVYVPRPHVARAA